MSFKIVDEGRHCVGPDGDNKGQNIACEIQGVLWLRVRSSRPH